MAVVILCGVGGLGYLGFKKIEERIDRQQSAVTSVVIELKAEALKEIGALATQTKEQLKIQGGDGQKNTETDLRTVVEEIRDQQTKIFETLAQLARPSTVSEPVIPPGSREDTFNQTIYFPLGKIKSPKISAQLKAALPELAQHVDGDTCRSNVLGFSDTLGGDISNLTLSQKRAEYIASELKKAGITVASVKGWGERWLQIHTLDATKNEMNRRVVIETHCDSKTIARSPVTS